MDQLLKRIESLEGQSNRDFAKYIALSMAESVAREAHCLSHEKASFLDAAVKGLRPRPQASTEIFQAYFLALLSDRDYTKVLDSLAKVDKAHKKAAPAPFQAFTLTSWEVFPLASMWKRQLIVTGDNSRHSMPLIINLLVVVTIINALCYWNKKDLMHVTLLVFFFFGPSTLGMAVLERES